MKKHWLLILIGFLAGSAILGYSIIDRMFPKAGPIPCPPESDITSITMTHQETTRIPDDSTINGLLQLILTAQPTRTMSINETPGTADYSTIEIHTAERMYLYHIYRQGLTLYIELPYEGVYTVDAQILDFFAD